MRFACAKAQRQLSNPFFLPRFYTLDKHHSPTVEVQCGRFETIFNALRSPPMEQKCSMPFSRIRKASICSVGKRRRETGQSYESAVLVYSQSQLHEALKRSLALVDKYLLFSISVRFTNASLLQSPHCTIQLYLVPSSVPLFRAMDRLLHGHRLLLPKETIVSSSDFVQPLQSQPCQSNSILRGNAAHSSSREREANAASKSGDEWGRSKNLSNGSTWTRS